MTTSSVEEKTWTILEVISASTDYLKSKGIDDARLNAELLLAHVLGCRRIDLYANFDQLLKDAERAHYKALLKRRVAREPLQYIVGETEFMGLRFFVNRRVLVPRPDTELLVERTVDLCRQYQEETQRIQVLDIGTGSGNIAVAVARFVGNAYVTGIDISAEALEVAKRNVEAHKLAERVALKQADVIKNSIQSVGEPFDIIVSNPPYISKEDFRYLSPEIRDYEPRFAACDEADGSIFFRRISEIAKRLLRGDGHLLFEVGFGQSEKVQEIMGKSGFTELEVFKELVGIERVVKGKIG